MGLDTIENVKTRLGITTDAYDTFLQTQVDVISDAIEGYCRRKFVEADYEQTFYRGDYKPCKMLELFHFPVSEIDTIEEDGVEVDAEDFRLHKPSGRLIRTNGVFFVSEETIVTFTAGFTAVPNPILSVLDSLVQERYNKKIAGVDLNFGSDVQRISIPGAISIDFDYTLNNNDRKNSFGALLGSNMNILDPYRSERAVLGEGRLIYVEDVPSGP